ncbi:MAG TPA: FlgD immunoglobulin-like domain containing protein [Jatrophihabitans sp.]|nr:FlgD immunoglobulin-like domain containing protein [Jatrophihabitans sp.]
MRNAARPEQPTHRFRPRVALAGLAAGAAALAVLAVPGTAYAAPPSTTPTNVQVNGETGTITLHADSTAAQVQFQIDNETPLAPVDVTSGTASLPWASWGYANGTDAHTLTAYDCVGGECATSGTQQTFTLSNTPPTLTTPAGGDEITLTGFPLTATSSGGSVQFQIDGGAFGPVVDDPYSTTYNGLALTAGPHTITAVQCALGDGTHCFGPSDATTVTAIDLGATINSIRPSPFSPNGDGVLDRATVAYSVSGADGLTVKFDVLNASSTVIRSVTLSGGQPAGSATWKWDGKNNAGNRAADGPYTIRLTVSKAVDGGTVQATAQKTVRIDATAPSLSSVRGDGATFYPHPDRYKDTFAPSVDLGARGTLKLVVKNSAGHVVRTIQATKAAGRRSLTWNGRNSANQIVAAGKYHWMFTATDAVGNTSKTASNVVNVSAKRLVLENKVVTRDGSAFGFADHSGCGASVSKPNSSFSRGGVLLSVNCGNRPGVALTEYNLRLPSAIRYGRMSLAAYGYSHRGFARVVPLVYSTGSQSYELTRSTFDVTSSSTAWRNLGSVRVDGHYTGGHVTHVVFGIGNAPSDPADFDVRSMRITVGCYVLR